MSVLTHRMPCKNRHEKNVPKHKKCSGTFSFIVREILIYLAPSQGGRTRSRSSSEQCRRTMLASFWGRGERGDGERRSPWAGCARKRSRPHAPMDGAPPVITGGTSRRKAAGAQKDADQRCRAKPLHMGDRWVTDSPKWAGNKKEDTGVAHVSS